MGSVGSPGDTVGSMHVKNEAHDDDIEGDWSGTVIDAAQMRRDPKVEHEVERIETLRGSIDNLDGAMVAILAERFRATDEIGHAKAAAGFGLEDPEREREQASRLRDLAEHAGLDAGIARRYMEFVVSEAKRRHQEIAEGRVGR